MQIRRSDREKLGTKSRYYLLASLFLGAVKVITDPKDGKALIIQTDPAYSAPSKWNERKEVKSKWNNGRVSTVSVWRSRV